MNNNDGSYNDFSSISLNALNRNKITRDKIFYLLLINTIIVLISLTLVLNPTRAMRNYFWKFIHISIFKIRLYHIMILIIGFYLYLYFALKDDLEQIDTENFEFVHERLIKFQNSYELESKIWMVFIIIICLLSIYRHFYLINKEEQLKTII